MVSFLFGSRLTMKSKVTNQQRNVAYHVGIDWLLHQYTGESSLGWKWGDARGIFWPLPKGMQHWTNNRKRELRKLGWSISTRQGIDRQQFWLESTHDHWHRPKWGDFLALDLPWIIIALLLGYQELQIAFYVLSIIINLLVVIFSYFKAFRQDLTRIERGWQQFQLANANLSLRLYDTYRFSITFLSFQHLQELTGWTV